MSLTPGTSLGPYEILGPIGKGGMGEVYRARDPRLGRDVAIKVIANTVNTDVDRLHRFEQEARAAAALNHPNILAVYDVGQHGGSPYIVAELLEGETLRERSASPISVRKAVEYAIQVAHGLAAAHEKGIVHRDLKPENVFITNDERAKILDFGLAKLVQADGVSATVLATAIGHTHPGMVLGTVGYMAPEQVRGLPADHRADLFAFGAILYEMLSGTRAFRGATPADVMTAILKEDVPDLSGEGRRIPPGLALIVERCLAKSPHARFRSADDLAFALESVFASSSSDEGRAVVTAVKRPTIRRWLAVAGVLAIGALIGATSTLVPFRHAAPGEGGRAVRAQLSLPENLRLLPSQPPALSPDGTRIAIVALDRESLRHSIYLRALDSETAQLVPGTNGAVYPFWSADGNRLAFFADSWLKTVDVTSGDLQNVCPVPNPNAPGAWVGDTIVFGRNAGQLQRVSERGGKVVSITPGGLSTDYVTGFLSDRTRIIFSAAGGSLGLSIGAIDGRSQESLGGAKDIPRAFLQAPWLLGPTLADGHLLFIRQTTLSAQSIDGAGLVTGVAHSIAQAIAPFPAGGGLPFSASETALVYVSGAASATRLMWFDRQGHPLGPVGPMTGFFRDPRFNADGTLLAVSRYNEADLVYDLMLLDVGRNTPSQLTHGTTAYYASWIPDRSELVFTSRGTINRVATIEGAVATPVLQSTNASLFSPGFSPDGGLVYASNTPPDSHNNLYASPAANPSNGHPWMPSSSYDYQPRLSSDGQWLAYASNESGPLEIFVRSFPDGGGKQQVSHGGGHRPVWSHDGGELFFLSSDGDLMAVPISYSPFRVGTAGKLFRTPIDPGALLTFYQYDVAPDGKRFVIVVPVSDVPQPINVILNWQSLLKR